MKIPWLKPAPVPSADEIPLSRDVHANPLSLTLFSWCTKTLKVGYTRPLQVEDLYRLDEPRLSTHTGALLEKNFYDRVPPNRRPRFLQPESYRAEQDERRAKARRRAESPDDLLNEKAGGLPQPVTNTDGATTDTTKRTPEEDKKFKKKYPGDDKGGKVLGEDGKSYDQSLLLAMSKTFFWPFWSSAVFLIISSTLQTTSPLVTKKMLSYITTSYVYANASVAERTAANLAVPKSAGYGIGLAVALFVMQEAASLFSNQYMFRGMNSGFLMRSSLIANISRKSLRLSGASRVKHPNGQLTTLVSSDASFLDWSAFLAHVVWVMPIQIVIGIILICINLGPSGLVGIGCLILNFPVQTFFVRKMFKTRQKQLSIVDQRVRLLQEVLNGIRVVKLYSYEGFFGDRIAGLRSKELDELKTIALTRAGMSATMSFVPILAAVLSFITYSLAGNELNPAIIFSTLQLFNVIRQPLVMLPMAFTVCSDAYVGIKRITTAMLAEELPDDLQIDPSLPSAIRAHGDFIWETSGPISGLMGGGSARGGRDWAGEKKKKQAAKQAKADKKKNKKGTDTPDSPLDEEKKDAIRDEDKPPFSLQGIDIEIARGSLTCIVGSVGSGKSSLLQGLIGEMKRTKGDVVFGGTTSYVSQSPWVMNSSFRDNILFSKPLDEDRFDDIVTACALPQDIEMLPYGLETELGENGITLSGGQKARVCLARAVYFNADVILLDDPLSAVDAHVSKHIVEKCILSGPLSSKTRVLVTHNLDVLPHADHIILMDSGRIVEQGTYADLMRDGDAFSKLIDEFGTMEKKEEKDEKKKAESDDETEVDVGKGDKKKKDNVVAAKLMQEEERETGTVSWSVYTHYARSMGSVVWAPLLFVVYAMAQIATVGNNIFLGFWSSQKIKAFHGDQGDYMAIYAAFGIAAGIFTFASTLLLYLRGITASYTLVNQALAGVMRSKVSWFDTTPIGRIVSRLSKDVTTLDNQLPMQINQLATMVFSVFGTIGLVIYTFPLLGIIFVPMFILYWAFASFYRASSREIKRIDSILRSGIYTNYGEMLSGMSSIRAYRQQDHFIERTEQAIDVENRAYFLSIALQRWLGVRLDFLGSILILGIGLFGVGFRDSVDPSKLGVVLTYSLSVTAVFSQLVSTFATVEQDMNTSERISHYSHLEPEGAVSTPQDPPADWPSQGCVEFKDVRLRYRDGLPEVLKGVSFSTRPGEKVGIVGRTGAGKSSLLQALFRIVELSAGSIIIDGHDISAIGLDPLRKKLAVIPQDALLYAGTVRENLDPVGERDDASLNDSLRRAGLVAPDDASEDVKTRFAKFKLDAPVSDAGANFSGGERQLVALCRALVKNSRVIVLDEATSSVDVETDSSIQKAIQVEFASQSLLCIAHRLATIAFYDRVLVMDAGQVAEFDTPLAVFDRPGSIFRGMCDKANLSRADIVRIRTGAGKADEAHVVEELQQAVLKAE